MPRFLASKDKVIFTCIMPFGFFFLWSRSIQFEFTTYKSTIRTVDARSIEMAGGVGVHFVVQYFRHFKSLLACRAIQFFVSFKTCYWFVVVQCTYEVLILECLGGNKDILFSFFFMQYNGQ